MVGREIVPYGAELNKKPDIRSSQSYFAQVVRRPVIVPPPPRPLLEGKPRQQEPRLDAQKLIKVTKEINLLPLKGPEVLTGVKTNKFGDVTCAMYRSVTSRTTIDGIQALADQIKVVLPRRERHHQLF
jgi:hypothetical protein